MLHTLLHNYDAHGGLGVKAHGFPHDPSALKFFVEILDARVASRNQETPFRSCEKQFMTWRSPVVLIFVLSKSALLASEYKLYA